MARQHRFSISVEWTGNRGEGTSSYAAYGRDHRIQAEGKPPIEGSSDPAFRGERSRYSPEDLLVSSLSACHMLWYLHLCAVNGVVVTDYTDAASGTMEEAADGSGAFSRVVLAPRVSIAAGSDPGKALALHEEAHRLCFIAKSVRFPVELRPTLAG